MTGTWGTTGITVDPNKSSTLYLDTDQRGLSKSTDWGVTWARLGAPPSAPNYGTTANYLDSPVEVRVDPADSQHLYAVKAYADKPKVCGFRMMEAPPGRSPRGS